jgi:hypothetical protein
MTRILLVLTGLVWLAASAGAVERDSERRPAPPAVTLSARGRIAVAPATFMATVRVTPHADNRVLRIAIEAQDYYASSDLQLAGLSAARSRTVKWTGLPAGNYCVVAILFRTTGRPIVARSRYLVTDTATLHIDMLQDRRDRINEAPCVVSAISDFEYE